MLNNLFEKIYFKFLNLSLKYKINHQHRLVDEFNYYKLYQSRYTTLTLIYNPTLIKLIFTSNGSV